MPYFFFVGWMMGLFRMSQGFLRMLQRFLGMLERLLRMGIFTAFDGLLQMLNRLLFLAIPSFAYLMTSLPYPSRREGRTRDALCEQHTTHQVCNHDRFKPTPMPSSLIIG